MCEGASKQTPDLRILTNRDGALPGFVTEVTSVSVLEIKYICLFAKKFLSGLRIPITDMSAIL